ncbi:hypothetical protein [Paenibacillus sp. AN1007]|uniref:DUF58 domain-containing protein n=1 Tax=Paenibacillus sp. AN1007 TaxID=3151385 RepID=A0AAU8NNR5_9BACL
MKDILSISIVLVLVALFWIFLLLLRSKQTKKITSYKDLPGTELVRYCSKEVIIDAHTVHLKPSGTEVSNYTNGKKPTLWFFVGEPTLWNLSKNAITSKEIKVTIPVSSLEITKLTYRTQDLVVGYTNEYIGSARIEYLKPHKNSKRLSIFKIINSPIFIYSAATVSVGLPMYYLFSHLL